MLIRKTNLSNRLSRAILIRTLRHTILLCFYKSLLLFTSFGWISIRFISSCFITIIIFIMSFYSYVIQRRSVVSFLFFFVILSLKNVGSTCEITAKVAICFIRFVPMLLFILMFSSFLQKIENYWNKGEHQKQLLIDVLQNTRSGCQRCSLKTGLLKNFTGFTGKHLCHSVFFTGLKACILLKRDSNTGVFLWNLPNFNTSFYRTTLVAASWTLVRKGL